MAAAQAAAGDFLLQLVDASRKPCRHGVRLVIDTLGELVDLSACLMVQLVDALGELGQSAADLPCRNGSQLDFPGGLPVGEAGV